MLSLATSLQWHFGVSWDILTIYPWFLQYASLKYRHSFPRPTVTNACLVMLAPWHRLLPDPRGFSLCPSVSFTAASPKSRGSPQTGGQITLCSRLPHFPPDNVIGVISFPVIRDRMDKIAYSHYSGNQTTPNGSWPDEFVFSFLRPNGARQALTSHSNRSPGPEWPKKQSLAPWVMHTPVLCINRLRQLLTVLTHQLGLKHVKCAKD